MSSRIQTITGGSVSADSTQGVLKLLAGYDLHTTGEHEPDQEVHNEQVDNQMSTTSHISRPMRSGEAAVTANQNPTWWPLDHNRMPDYRPVNHGLDRSQRPAGNSTFEFIFINGMLSGVCAVSGTSKLWRATAGRLAPRIFHYEVGGQW